jgi:hypothetical protein
MNGAPSPSLDRAISCAMALGILCMTLLILGVVLLSVTTS